VKSNEVMRVLPLENEAINECWIADRDRFSYEGLNSAERLQKPMIKFDGKWHETDWETALAYVVKGLNGDPPITARMPSASSPARTPPPKNCIWHKSWLAALV
jgi:NADH dehydrogenase/NADH:ubiquinone oxidoreductase subunit G